MRWAQENAGRHPVTLCSKSCANAAKQNVKIHPFCLIMCQFQVLNPDNTPAKLVKMLVQPGSMLARTGANGFVKLPMNTKESDQKLTITASICFVAAKRLLKVATVIILMRVCVVSDRDHRPCSCTSQTGCSHVRSSSIHQCHQQLHPHR